MFKPNPGLVSAAAGAAVFAALAFLPAMLDGESLYWHIAAGRWMLENYAVLRIDTFSYTQAGHPWATQDWLSEVLMALAYIGAGWSGVLALFAAAAAAAAALVARCAARRLGGAGLPVVLLLCFAAAAAGLAARPDLLALPLFVLWTAGLVDAGEEGRAPSFKLLPVMMLWANLEPGFVAGLIVLAAFWLEAALQSHNTRRWGIFAGFALVAALITPYGVAGLIHAAALVAAPRGSGVDPWTAVPLAAASTAAVLVLVLRRRKVAPLRVGLLLWLAFAALVQRQNPLLVAAAFPLLLAAPLAAALSATAGKMRPQPRALLVVTAVAAIVAGWRLWLPVERGDEEATPASALAHVPPELAHTPVLNQRAFGGFLIFRNVRPYIDGRTGLYSQPFLDRYARMMQPDAALLKNTLSRHRIHWTIFKADSPAVGAMDAMADWHRLYADRWAVIHVRSEMK